MLETPAKSIRLPHTGIFDLCSRDDEERKQAVTLKTKFVSVVIIDDNPRSLEFISTALSRPNVEVLTASKPEDGLALVFLHRPQVVLTDLVMPNLSGLDVLQRVKQFDPAIEVVVMSARESKGSPTKALQQGATDFLSKPISLSVLRERIGRLIQKHITE